MQNECIACGSSITHELYHPPNHPLSVLALPRSADEARGMLRFPMNFRTCASCGHVFNVEFEYYRIPYEEDSNLMYNRAPRWLRHMEALVETLLSRHDAAGKTLADIGCGDGGFLKLLLDRNAGCRCVGFEPGVESRTAQANGLEVYRDYFIAERDLKRIKPDFLVIRHVLEHMQSPRQFVAEIAYWSNIHDVFPVVLAEVPRIDNALRQHRINDFLYEHPSNFTQHSFENMFRLAGFDVIECVPCYGDEVTVVIAAPAQTPRLNSIRAQCTTTRRGLQIQAVRVRQSLNQMRKRGLKVAFWGATGKGASFLNAFDLFAEEWPIVVDSDINKVGRFVPRTAQQILPPEHLVDNPVDVIVITTQWRARDIADEIATRGISFGRLLVVTDGKLRDLDPAGEEPAKAGASALRRTIASAKSRDAVVRSAVLPGS